MSNLGTDMLLEVLVRLPVKSLNRFKCVSKSFKSLISSKDLAQLHLRHHPAILPSSANEFVVLPNKNRITCCGLDSIVTSTFGWHNNITVDAVVGSCNGLVCIYTSDSKGLDKLCVLNPTTQIWRDIHMPANVGAHPNFGFAFDSENLDFKVVVVFDIKSPGLIKTRITKVYSLNADSWWEMETKYSPDQIVVGTNGSECGMLINNSLLLWKFFNPFWVKYKIGCFDVCKSKWTFDVVLPHDYFSDGSCHLCTFGVFDECLFSTFSSMVESCYDVWVMKEYGVQDSWVKLLSIPFSRGYYDRVTTVEPVAYRKGSSDVLIREINPGRLLWYNRNNGEISAAKFAGALLFRNKVYMCNKSLVDIPGGKLFGI